MKRRGKLAGVTSLGLLSFLANPLVVAAVVGAAVWLVGPRRPSASTR